MKGNHCFLSVIDMACNTLKVISQLQVCCVQDTSSYVSYVSCRRWALQRPLVKEAWHGSHGNSMMSFYTRRTPAESHYYRYLNSFLSSLVLQIGVYVGKTLFAFNFIFWGCCESKQRSHSLLFFFSVSIIPLQIVFTASHKSTFDVNVIVLLSLRIIWYFPPFLFYLKNGLIQN